MTKDFPFVTVDEAAQTLGITLRGVLKMIERGELPGSRKVDESKQTSAWLIPLDALKAAQKKRAQSSSD